MDAGVPNLPGQRLDDQERVKVLETVITQTRGCVPAIVGRTSGGMRAFIVYSCQAKQLGAAAVVVSCLVRPN